MNITEKDRTILRDLAQRYAEAAADPVQQEKAELWRRLNRREPVRPMVMLWNDTWHETGDEIDMQCADEFARQQEWRLRTCLYHWDHMKDDHVYEPVVHSPVAVNISDLGLELDATRPDHAFGASRYNPVIGDDDDPEKVIRMPEVTVDHEATERNYQRLQDIYGGILPVKKRGRSRFIFAVVDEFIRFRGLENTFVDLVERPAWVHAWIARITQYHLSALDQLEALGVLELNNDSTAVGPGGPGFTDELPRDNHDGTVRTRDMWAHATTQIFADVSPVMHEEFALRYEKRLLGRFGLTGYGCCEPLDRKVDLLRRHLSNLRRVSMSPWVDVETGAQAIGRDYVFSYKPNPEILGHDTWDVDAARKRLRDALEKTRHCAVEVVMKDLHTCNRQPQRMWEWVDMAMDLAQEYA